MISVSIVLLPSPSKLHMRSSMVSARSPMSGHGVRSSVYLFPGPVSATVTIFILLTETNDYNVIQLLSRYQNNIIVVVVGFHCSGLRIVSRPADRFAFDGSFGVRRIVLRPAGGGSRAVTSALWSLRWPPGGGVTQRHVKNRYAEPLPPLPPDPVSCTGTDDTSATALQTASAAGGGIGLQIIFPRSSRLSADQSTSHQK